MELALDHSGVNLYEPGADGSRRAAVQLVGVSKSYAGFPAITGVDIELASGRFLTLLGPSGSGKTTTLHIVAGFTDPTSGDVLLDGEPMTTAPPERRNLGVVFQNYALFPHMTVAQNVGFPLRMRSVDRREAERRVTETLEVVEMAAFADRPATKLSGGQQQRVALARALVYRPSVLLMDEPLAALDKNLRQQMQYELKRIQAEFALTVIFVTHDQEEALTLSDEIAVFNEGRIVQTGSPRDVYERPGSLFVAQFLGEANVLSAEVETAAPGSCTAALRDGTLLAARCEQTVAVGDQVDVVIRPENTRFVDRDEGFGIDAHVEQVAFCGDSIRLVAALRGGDHVVVRAPAAAAVPAVGEPTRVGWDSQSATVLGA